MKRILLLFVMLLWATIGVFAQCEAPSNFEAHPFWNRVSLSWETSNMGFLDTLTYGESYSTRIGTNDADTFTVAIRFTPSELSSANGQYLSHVAFIPGETTVHEFTIKIWVGGSHPDASTFNEGTLVSSEVVLPSQVTTASWNVIPLTTPVLIDATQELWIGYECTATGGYPAGAGADNVINGTNDLIGFEGNWTTLASSGLTYGWCIMGYTKDLSISGFNILRNNVQLNTSLITDNNYIDTDVLPETQYCYTIQSVCASSTANSNEICVTTPVQPNCGPIIGNGTGTTYYIPFNSYYNYSYVQELFQASELGVQAGTIASLSFHYFHNTPITRNNVTVYMGNVSQSSFSSTSDWVPAENLVQVFQGSLLCSNVDSNLVTIEFDESFEWDGHSNIVVAILNGHGSYENSDERFYTHTTTDNKVLYAYNDNNIYNIASPGTGTLSSSRNNMQFCFGPAPSCYRPTQLEVLSTTGDGAVLSWRRHSSTDSQWDVVVVPAGASVSSGTAVTVSDTNYTVSGLNENEAYDVYVRTVCSETDQSVWVSTSFRTRCTSIHVGVPYIDNFTGYGEGAEAFPYCWQRFTNHESITYPYITSASALTGQMIFFSNATTYSLAVSQALDLSAYSAGSLALSYWIAQAQSYYGRMDIGIMTDPNDMNTFTLLKSYYPSDYDETGYFQEDMILLPDSYSDIVYIAFLAPASGNNSTNMVHLSHVMVDYAPTCSAPSNLAVSHVDGTSATLSWEEAPFGADNYTLEYGTAGQAATTITVSGNEYMLTGLTQGSAYNVMLYSNCVEGTADTLTVSFTTLAFLECTQADTTGREITGTTATTTYRFPVNNFYNYSYTQQIFTADEIDSTHTPTVITGVAFDYANTLQNTEKTDVKIYLAHRSSSTFASTTDWTAISDATLVYEGDLICTQGWNTFNFDTYFSYNGSDNLVLIVDDNSGIYNGSSYVFNAHTLSDYASMYYQNDGTNPDPANPPTGTLAYERNDVKFFCCAQIAPVSCPRPYVYVTNADETSITIEWQANGDENEWNLEYMAEGDTVWTPEGNISSSPYTIQNLSSDIHYNIRLQAACSTTESSEWAYTSAYTPCESIELPIIENFDSYSNNEIPTCWTRMYNGTSASPYITSAQAYSGSKSMYFYCPSNGNYAYAVCPRLDESTMMDSLQIMFYAYTATAGYFIEVGIMEDPSNPNSFSTLGQFNPSTPQTWEMGELLSRRYTGEGRYVAFRVPQWYANNIYIDDIDIHYIPSCMHVNNITSDNITPFTADISWTAGGSENQWNYIVGPAGTVDPTSDSPVMANSNIINISGLSANTLYEIYVQAYCGADDQSTWMHSYFRTECAAMTTLPYEENFDTYTGTTSTSTNVLPNCWASINGGSSYAGLPTIYNSSSYAHSGHNSMYFYTYNSTSYANQYAILPEIDTTAIPMNSLQLLFAARSSSSSYTFNIQVGVMSDPTDANTFQLVSTVPVYSTSYDNYEVYFDTFNGNGQYVALKVEKPTSGYNYGYIDDIMLDVIPTCSPVRDLTVSHLAGSSAMISWNHGPFGTVSSYSLEYSEAGQDNWITVSNDLTTTSYMLGNLEPTTSYDVRVRVNCEENEESAWTTKTFTTRCLAGGENAIGNGTTTNNYLPSYSLYKYGFSQQIFTAAEMGAASNITSVSLEMANLSQQRTYKIYLMHTSETSVSSWIPCSNAQLVFSDNQTLVQGWNTFEFSTPFAYNGSDNLVLIFVDETGSYVSGNSWYTHSATPNCSRYIYSDGTQYDIYSTPSSGTQASLSVRNNVIFGGNCDSTATCFAPNMYVDNVDTTSADVIWVPSYDESSWELEYALYSDSVWTPVANPTGGTVTIDQLSSNTHYKVRMRSVCAPGDESSWIVADFRTECGITSIPFAEDFNSYGTSNYAFPDCWIRDNNYSTATPYPYISTVNNSGATGGSLYFYATSSTYNMAVTPELNTDVNSLEVTFFLNTNNIANGMIVGVMDDANNIGSFIPVDTVFCTSTSIFEYKEVDLDNYAGTGKFIAFKNYIVSSGSMYLDDLYITLIPSCKRPDNVTVSNIDMTSAEVAWTERGNAVAWEIEYGAPGFTPGTGTSVSATQNPFTLTGLTSGTTYDVYVRANCGAGDLSDWSINHATFTTSLCNSSDQCEYRFVCKDSYGDGWNDAYVAVQQNGVTVAIVEAINHSQSSVETVDTIRVMLCDSVNTTFIWNTGMYDSEASLAVIAPNGVVLYDQTDMSYISSPTLLTFTTDCNALPPTPPTCDAPTNLTITDISATSATISWTPGGNENAWNLQYRLASVASDEWSELIHVTNTPSYTITDLAASTAYQVRVQADCGDNNLSYFISDGFTTEVGIHDMELTSRISLQPNPADKYIELNINSTMEMTEALVYNAFGQLIQTVQLTDNHARIDLSNMAAGMYFVRVNGDNMTATKKFIRK